MSIAEKIARAKTDLDEVHAAGIAEGKQSAYDEFWDKYQDFGKRTSYSIYAGAFGGQYWTDDLFKPKYAMQPKSAEMMFRATGITDLTREDIV